MQRGVALKAKVTPTADQTVRLFEEIRGGLVCQGSKKRYINETVRLGKVKWSKCWRNRESGASDRARVRVLVSNACGSCVREW